MKITSEMLDDVARSVPADLRDDMRRLAHTLTAQGRDRYEVGRMICRPLVAIGIPADEAAIITLVISKMLDAAA